MTHETKPEEIPADVIKAATEFQNMVDRDPKAYAAFDVAVLAIMADRQRKKGTPVELKDLVGKGLLDAVDFDTEALATYDGSEELEDCRVCRFRFRGIIYVAVEDPNDGYRSSMRNLVVQKGVKMLNEFPAAEVVGIHRSLRGYEKCDILELVDTSNGKTVLEVGTQATSDYYPSFVSAFHPENLSSNNGEAQ